MRWIGIGIGALVFLAGCSSGDEPSGGDGGRSSVSGPGAGGSEPTGGTASNGAGGGGSKPFVVQPGKKYPSVSGDADPVPGKWRDITPVPIDPKATACTDLKFDPSNPSVLYALYGSGGGLWQSVDGGKSWVQFGDMPMPNSLGRILIDPKDPKHLYMTGGVVEFGGFGFFVSHDGGATWKTPPAFTEGVASGAWVADLYNIVADPEDFDHILITSHSPWSCCGVDDAGILESRDGGETFVAHQPPAGMNHGNGVAFLSDPATGQGNGDSWLVGGGYVSGIFRTTNAGESWSRVSEAQDNHGGFYATYSKQGFLYIGVSGGIDRSTDNGKTWTSAMSGLGGWYYGAVSDGKELITSAGFVGQPINAPFSRAPEGGANEGQTWTAYSDEVSADGSWRMIFEPSDRIVYNAAWAGGAWALNVLP